MTSINLPGCRSAGLADWGVKTVPEMIAKMRAHHQHKLEVAQQVLAASDADFLIEVVRGPIVRRRVNTLQQGRSPDQGSK